MIPIFKSNDFHIAVSNAVFSYLLLRSFVMTIEPYLLDVRAILLCGGGTGAGSMEVLRAFFS
jgi:hypothetical protein